MKPGDPKPNKRASDTMVIAGKKVKVAKPQDVAAAVNHVKTEYAGALENLKNR